MSMIIHKVHIFYHEFVATFFGHKVSQENMEFELSDVASLMWSIKTFNKLKFLF